jgi:lycopene cyclase domain-containing protein
MFGQYFYLTTLLFVILASFWLEFAFQLNVLRDPIRLLKTLALSTPLFILWDAYAIANSHWVVNPELTTGIFGPLGIPLEEYLFFIIVPIAAILTLEGVAAFVPTAARWYLAIKKAVS